MLKLLIVKALVGAVYTQSSPLPEVDLGYEVHQAAGFNSIGNFYNFTNIRYAAPPAEPGWFQEATAYGISRLLGLPYNMTQPYTPSGAKSSSAVPAQNPNETEDCLFLDVFVPKDVLTKAGKGFGVPVLVWIYGGGYTIGSKANDPAGLLAASGNSSHGEVIYVALNYRLGALGFLAGPSFNAEGGVSNLGLYDQRFALEWVQKYIHHFGGDKNRVTVFGESAGGGSIIHQITAYGGAKGKAPFQQALPQSPGWFPIQSNVQTEDTYQKLLNLTNTSSLAGLRALPSEVIMRANTQQVFYNSPYGTFTYGPVVDGNFVPLRPGQLLAQGRFDKDVRVMVGHNADEGAFFTPTTIHSDETLQAYLKGLFPVASQQVISHITDTVYPPVFDGSFPYHDQYSRAALLVSEGIFTCNTNYLSTGLGNKTYSYLFAVPPALHGLDVSYTYYTGGPASLAVANTTIATTMQRFITSFAKEGQPTANGIPTFKMYGSNASVLKLNITSIDEVHDSNTNTRCSWWQKALF